VIFMMITRGNRGEASHCYRYFFAGNPIIFESRN
jgi:hypothetical protein